MRFEEDLTLQVSNVLAANMVPDLRNGYDECDEAHAAVMDARGGVERLLQMASRELQDVGVAPPEGTPPSGPRIADTDRLPNFLSQVS
jgi:hypothetical protein